MVKSVCFVIITSFLFLGCGDDGVNADPDTGPGADSTAADTTSTTKVTSISFDKLEDYDGFTKTASIVAKLEGTASKIELLADGKVVATLTSSPFTFSWDTTKTTDGVIKLGLKAYDSTTSVTTKSDVPVVVYNNGEKITWVSSKSTGKVIVPTSGYVEQHLKYHWMMTDSVKKVITVVKWDKTGFELELAIGTGTCPHSGTTATKSTSKTSPFAVTYGDGKTSLVKTQWFGHVDLMNKTDTAISGKDTSFTLFGYLLK